MPLIIPFPKNNDKDIVPGVYEILHKPTGKSYIGSTGNLGSRKGTNTSALRNGKHKNPNLQKAYNENPDIEFKILAIADSAEEALDKEQKFLDERMPTGTLFNVGIDSRASFRGRKHSSEHIERLAECARNRVFSPEAIESIRQSRLGTKHSEESKAKISAFVSSPEFIEKMKKINTGRKLTEEQKQNISKAQLGKKHSEEAKQNMRESAKDRAKPVIIKGIQYDSIKAAARALNMNNGGLSNKVNNGNDPDYQFVK
jgi:group I intron endonuclease